MTLKLHVVICSTRPGRVGPAVANWFVNHSKQYSEFDVELVDLAAFDLPLYDEANHPATGIYEKEHTKVWSTSVAKADAYVCVPCR